MLPNFLIIGAMKCGTTSLHRYLRGHPDVFMHPVQELRFFTEEHNLGRGLTWYRNQFAGVGPVAAVGEASNVYARYPVYKGVPERIARVLPDVRLVYLVRHPMARLESHYRHRLVTGIEWRTAAEAVRADRRYIAVSMYGQQLQQYLQHFRAQQILTIRSEHLFSQPTEVLRRICDFLGVDGGRGPPFSASNVSAERSVAPVALRNLARFPAAKKAVKKASKLLHRSPLRRFAQTADQPAFVLSHRQRAELVSLFDRDRKILAEITGETFDDWDLESGAPELAAHFNPRRLRSDAT
jgi:Sulfotransferase domain